MKTELDSLTCGVAKTLKIIGGKWTMLILRDLFEDTRRFGELQKSLKGISSRTLSLRLDQLADDGLVHKKIFAEVPARVEYSLTDKGKSLSHIIQEMREWGEQTN